MNANHTDHKVKAVLVPQGTDVTHANVLTEDANTLAQVRAYLFMEGTPIGNGFFQGIIRDPSGKAHLAIASLSVNSVFFMKGGAL